MGSSSTEVDGEAVLVTSVPETRGVTEAGGVAERPFPITRTVFLPMLDKGSSFLALILAYISLLNFDVITVKRKTLATKKSTRKEKVSTDEARTYSFFLLC